MAKRLGYVLWWTGLLFGLLSIAFFAFGLAGMINGSISTSAVNFYWSFLGLGIVLLLAGRALRYIFSGD